MKRPVVVHVIDSMEVGGAQTQILNLFETLDQTRFDLRLVCLREKGAWGERLERAGFPVVCMEKKSGRDLAALFRLVKIFRRWRPTIVHCTIFTANLWGRIAALLAGVPIRIAHEQSTVSLEKPVRKMLDRLLAGFTWRILVVSEDLRRRVAQEEGVAPDKITVLYNAIDTMAIARASAGKPLDLPGETGFRLGAVGRVEYRKDHITLARAAAQVLKAEPKATFLLAGDGPDRSRLEAEIEALGIAERFHLLGTRQDVPRLLHHLDVYVLSSTTEGLSLSILEAMAAGLPVVATRVGGNAELVTPGETGALVPASDPQALAEALLEVLRAPARRKAFGAAARRQVREHFDIAVIAGRLESLYLQALREKGLMQK